MAKIKRIVSTGFWNDKKVMDEFSPEDKYFMLYLLTNPHTTQLGIYELPISSASNETGYTKDVIKVLIERFETKYDTIKYSKETGEIAIKNYLKHSIIKGGKPVMDCLLKEEKAVKDKALLEYIYDNLSNSDIENTTVLEYIEHIKSNYIDTNINNNDNDNERIVDESSRALELFEQLWLLYPLKKGKSKVSMTTKKKLLAIGYDRLSKAIQKYIDYVESVEWLHYQNGVTFFNGTYNDYIDDETETGEPPAVDNGQVYADDYWQ